jgi:secreted trypsin-like serine protease
MNWMMLSVAAFAEGPPPPIVNGERTWDFEQAGALMAYDDQHGGSVFCTGTLIHEYWLVTAAHCLAAADDYDRYGMDVLFVIGDNVFSENGIDDYDKAVSWEIHPDYDDRQLQHDIGVMELETGFDYIEPMPLGTEVPSTLWSEDELQYVGWGVTGDNREDSGVKRTVSIPYYDYDEQFVYSIDPAGERNLCSGDSGGPALRLMEDGSYALIGVNSFVFGVFSEETACEGGGSGATRIDSNLEWVESHLPEPEPEPAEETDTGDSGATEDEPNKLFGCSALPRGSAGMLCLALLALAARRET